MYKVKLKESEKTFDIRFEENGISVNNELVEVDIEKIKDQVYHIIKNYKGFTVEIIAVDRYKKEIQLTINDKFAVLQLKDDMDLLLEKMGMSVDSLQQVSDVKSPMPGLVLDIKIAEGDTVEKGTPLLILEAMKMENIIKSTGKGVVKTIRVNKGQAVEKNELLVEMA